MMSKSSGIFIGLLALSISSYAPAVVASKATKQNLSQDTTVLARQSSNAQAARATKAREDEIPSFDENGMVAHRRRYSNYEYAYEIEIPRTLVGFSSPAPYPQHGIGISLSKKPKSYIWVDGSYNSFFFKSLDEAIKQQLEFLAERGKEIQVLRREKTKLQRLPAMRLVAKYKSLATGEIRVQDVAIAFRSYDGEVNGITYTAGLITSESRYKDDVAVLEQIMNGWKVKPLPRFR